MEKVLNEGVALENEFLEFKAGGNFYGINIDDIREILIYNKKPTPIPNSHPFIEGMIMPRDFIIPVVNFVKSLGLEDVDDFKHEMLIVTRINNMNIGFHVDSVHGIQKIMSKDITKPGKKLSTAQKEVVEGVLTRGDKKIEIINLRKIIHLIKPEITFY